MSVDYQDRWVGCAPNDVRLRAYYFPWGTKRIRYASIRAVRRVELSTVRGMWRIWGTTNPRYWANLDPQRPRKRVGLILDLGRHIRPFVTPDDPDAVEGLICDRAHLPAGSGDAGQGPII